MNPLKTWMGTFKDKSYKKGLLSPVFAAKSTLTKECSTSTWQPLIPKLTKRTRYGGVTGYSSMRWSKASKAVTKFSLKSGTKTRCTWRRSRRTGWITLLTRSTVVSSAFAGNISNSWEPWKSTSGRSITTWGGKQGLWSISWFTQGKTRPITLTRSSPASINAVAEGRIHVLPHWIFTSETSTEGSLLCERRTLIKIQTKNLWQDHSRVKRESKVEKSSLMKELI